MANPPTDEERAVLLRNWSVISPIILPASYSRGSDSSQMIQFRTVGIGYQLQQSVEKRDCPLSCRRAFWERKVWCGFNGRHEEEVGDFA